jgi:glucose/arabinose dehydrogenase
MQAKWRAAAPLVAFAAVLLSGCYGMRPTAGGGKTAFHPPRAVRAADISVPRGYRIEAVATGLTFPSAVALDREGQVFVLEAGYSYGEAWDAPRLLRVSSDGSTTPVATGSRNGPWNGLTYYEGAFYVAEGGEMDGGRILKVGSDGGLSTVVEHLPSFGDHHTNGPAVGNDGWLYFGQGTATNSAVVGEDNYVFGWLKRKPEFHDTPCQDVTLAGANFDSKNPLDGNGGRVTTGAFLPFGTSSKAGQVIRGAVPCNGAVLRVRPGGGDVELVAWGFRNPFGLAFSPDGQLYVTDNGYDERGSRPVWGTADLLWKVTPGTWYGWPDFAGDRPLTEKMHDPPGKPRPTPLLSVYPGKPPRPAALFAVHSSADGFDFSRNSAFGHVGQAFVAEFGDMAPGAGKVLHPVGFKVVRVDIETGVIQDFAVNRGGTNGPASRIGGGGLERPVAVRFSPDGAALYVVDFGVMTTTERGPVPRKATGVLWRVVREGA